MAELVPETLFDALALSNVAQQLLLIQTQQANHVADLEKQIAGLKDEVKREATVVKIRDVQIASLDRELNKLKREQAQTPRKPLVVRLPPATIRGPQSPSLPSSLDSPQSAHIRTKSASDISNDRYDPIKTPMPQFKRITTRAGGLGGSRTIGHSWTGPYRTAALRFQDIPYQIQRKIWQYSMPAPQVLELRKVPQKQSQQTLRGNASTAPPKYVLVGDLPAAFHTCQLSRVEILRTYSRLARQKTTQNDEALVKRTDNIDSYADLKRDTVYIGGMEGRTIEELHRDLGSWPLFQDVQYLAVEMGVWGPLVERRHTLHGLILRAKALREITIVVGEERSVPQAGLGKPLILLDCQNGDHEEELCSMEAMISGLLLRSSVKPPKIRMCRLRRRPAVSVIRDTAPTLTSTLATPSLVQKPDDATGSPAAESNVSDDQPAVAFTKGDFNFSFTYSDEPFGPIQFTPHSFVAGARDYRSGSSKVDKIYTSDGDHISRFAPIPPDATPGNLPFTFFLGQPKTE